MRAIDQASIKGDLNTGYSYMLKAGMGLFLAVKDIAPLAGDGEIAVVCGKGNNGGDGYVVARLLLEAGYRVMCFSLCDTRELRGEAARALDEYIARKGNILVIDDAGALPGFGRYRLIVDAMLGTGAKGDPHGLCAMAIRAVNESEIPVVAVDTPSGLENDTGVPGNPCIRAVATITMGYPKIGLYWHPGRDLAGRLIVHDLGYPDEIVEERAGSCFTPDIRYLRTLLPPRKPAGSKFDHGLALLVCGSRGMTGSAILAAAAAMRTGCGMTHCAASESIVELLSQHLVETVIHPIAETIAGSPDIAAAKRIVELSASMQALCIGPGISHDPSTSALVKELVSSVALPIILDADGINAFKGDAGSLAAHRGELVITPHRGEWKRLFGALPHEPAALIEAVRTVAMRCRMTVLLKGSPSIVAEPGGKTVILPFGNSALAKAGSGDVLSGIIVSLLAQGASVTDAAILGSFLHGEAGMIASNNLGEYSVIARDVVESIAPAILHLTGKEGRV
jgi:NAD(P)H-hydrate epimerase